MIIQLTTTQWLGLPMDVRTRLKEVFGIPRSEGARIEDNRVMSDGHSHRDLSVVTVERMQEYLGNPRQKDFFKLLDQVLSKVGDELALTSTALPPSDAVVIAKPVEELFIEHHGKTYKLTEVTPDAAVPSNAPLYPQAPLQPAQQPVTAGAGTGKGAGKTITRRGGGKGSRTKVK